MGKRIDVKKGDKYNRLTIIREVKKVEGYRYFLCKCDCGIFKRLSFKKISCGQTKSCGCLQKEKIIKIQTTHGLYRSKAYKIWASAKGRCLNKNNDRYSSYGGRGIKICKKWLKFENFYKDMGERPEGKSIDRIDNDGDYCKENCRWATRKQQANNTRKSIRITYNGETKTLADWVIKTGLQYNTINTRIHRGWSIKKSLTTDIGGKVLLK